VEYQRQINSSRCCEEVEVDPEMLVGGVKVQYYFHCKTQLWLFSKFLNREQESELVVIGKIIERNTFDRIRSRNISIDQKISIDLVRYKGGLVIYDVKKSSKFKEAHRYQVLYYLWYLKKVKGIKNVRGVIVYPTERRRVYLDLTPDEEKRIEDILRDINSIISRSKPPPPIYRKFCRKCAYFEFCWV